VRWVEWGMDIQIDPTIDEIAAFDGLTFDPQRHEILQDGEWVRFLQRKLDLPGLFIYRHRFTKKFVLAYWTKKDYGICRELEILDGPPGRPNTSLPTLDYMRRRTRPVFEQRMEHAEGLKGMRAEQRDMEMDSELERYDKVKHLKRQGLDDAARVLESGVPFTGKKEGGSHLEQVKESLKDAGKAHWKGV